MNKYIIKIILRISDIFYHYGYPDWLKSKILGTSKILDEGYWSLTSFEVSDNMFITLCTHNNKDSYFIVYNNKDPYLATKCARINLLKPKYITKKHFGFKRNWVLNENEIGEFISILNDAPQFKSKFKNNYELALSYENNKTIQSTNIPDYTKLKYDKHKSKN